MRRNKPVVTFGLYSPNNHRCRTYGLSNLVGDITLTCSTFGLWAVWWIIRELRR